MNSAKRHWLFERLSDELIIEYKKDNPPKNSRSIRIDDLLWYSEQKAIAYLATKNYNRWFNLWTKIRKK